MSRIDHRYNDDNAVEDVSPRFPSLQTSSLDKRQRSRSEELMTANKNDEPDQQATNTRQGDILDPNNQIGVRLRSLYSAAQDEEIPDRFLDLLEKLDQAEMMSSAKMAE